MGASTKDGRLHIAVGHAVGATGANTVATVLAGVSVDEKRLEELDTSFRMMIRRSGRFSATQSLCFRNVIALG